MIVMPIAGAIVLRKRGLIIVPEALIVLFVVFV